MHIGNLPAVPALDRPDLLAPAVAAALRELAGKLPADQVGVAEIDPAMADTAAFCERYGVALTESANCVVVAGRREGQTRMAACMVLAATRADVNGLVKRELDVRKASFAATEAAVELTGMEFGGITPIGLPARVAIVRRRGRCFYRLDNHRQRPAPVQAHVARRGGSQPARRGGAGRPRPLTWGAVAASRYGSQDTFPTSNA